jgi:hypothetical protein
MAHVLVVNYNYNYNLSQQHISMRNANFVVRGKALAALKLVMVISVNGNDGRVLSVAEVAFLASIVGGEKE